MPSLLQARHHGSSLVLEEAQQFRDGGELPRPIPAGSIERTSDSPYPSLRRFSTCSRNSWEHAAINFRKFRSRRIPAEIRSQLTLDCRPMGNNLVVERCLVLRLTRHDFRPLPVSIYEFRRLVFARWIENFVFRILISS